jgi:hypothetical protein
VKKALEKESETCFFLWKWLEKAGSAEKLEMGVQWARTFGCFSIEFWKSMMSRLLRPCVLIILYTMSDKSHCLKFSKFQSDK